MNVLSIQSHVAYGHVGNAAATFPLQRLGLEVWPIHTVQFSNHTGYGHWTGQVFPADWIIALLDGIEARGGLAGCDALLSGYAGDAATGAAIKQAHDRLRALRPDVLYCCDPVMGDVERGMFVREGIPEMMRDLLLPAADIATPNQFELEWLSGQSINSLEDALAAAALLRARGPRLVVVTSLRRSDAPANAIECLVASDEGAWLTSSPLLAFDPPPNGCGDALAALFLGHSLRGAPPAEALSLTVSGLHGMLRITQQCRTREIQLVAAQDEFVHPSQIFPAMQIFPPIQVG